MLSYLKENYHVGGAEKTNRAILIEADEKLSKTILSGYEDAESYGSEVTWFEQLIRLAALLHDISHLPFGHTLEDQAGFLSRHDEDDDRSKAIFQRLDEELNDSPHLTGEKGARLRKILDRLLEQCFAMPKLKAKVVQFEALAKDSSGSVGKTLRGLIEKEKKDNPMFPYLTLGNDVVNNTICADLIDYLHRDSLNCGMPWLLDKALLTHLKVLEKKEMPGVKRLGVSVVRNGKLRHDVVTAVLGLLRARYDITEKVYYHHTKCAADAMLEKVVRSTKKEKKGEPPTYLDWKPILDKNLGDEGFMNHLENELAGNMEALNVLSRLQSRRFFKTAYRIRGRNNQLSAKTNEKIEGCGTPEGREKVEHEIANGLNLKTSNIIVSYLPHNMQLKEAEALVEWTDGAVLKLSELPKEKNYLLEVENLTNRYLDLWSLTVHVSTDYAETHIMAVQSKCEAIFGHRNDSLTEEYIRSVYPFTSTIKELTASIVRDAELATIEQLAVAYSGGDPNTERDIDEVLLDKLQNAINEKKLENKNRREKATKKSNSRTVTTIQNSLIDNDPGKA